MKGLRIENWIKKSVIVVKNHIVQSIHKLIKEKLLFFIFFCIHKAQIKLLKLLLEKGRIATYFFIGTVQYSAICVIFFTKKAKFLSTFIKSVKDAWNY